MRTLSIPGPVGTGRLAHKIRIPTAALLVALLGASLPSAGCMFFTSRKEGETLQKQVKVLEGQMAELHKQGLASLRKELAELKELLPQARALLLRNSARFGVKLDRLVGEVDRLKGRVENLAADVGGGSKQEKTLKAQVARLTETVEQLRIELTRIVLEVRRQQAEPTTAAELFARATVRRLAGQLAEARQDYLALVKRFPNDPRVDEAYYRVAQTHQAAFEFKAAAVAVARLLKARPGSRFEAQGRLLSAQSHMELKDCRTAIRILARLVRTHPQDEAAPQARRLLARLQRIQNVARYCR